MIRGAEVVVACRDLHAMQAFFVERLGLRVDAVFPADDPREVVVSGHGVRLLLRRGDDAPATLRVHVDDADAFVGPRVAPNGMRVEVVPTGAAPVVPGAQRAVVVSRPRDGGWHRGRAGMEYRDLLPGRLGGHLVASHIRIAAGGTVPDQVHFHRVRYQVIHCLRGAVRLVYEDQGAPFWMRAGELVLQPPGIRHRVLECEPGLEVVEVTCPAEHETLADHELELPTGQVRREREFGGQRFVHARSVRTAVGVGGGELRARVASGALRGDGFVFAFLRAGSAELVVDGERFGRLDAGSAFTAPGGVSRALVAPSADCEWFEVTMPSASPDPTSGAAG